MRFDLSRFKSGTDRIDRTYEPGVFASATADTDDFLVAEPVHLTLDVKKNGNRVAMTGRVTTVLEVACSRCLEPYRVPVDARVDLRRRRNQPGRSQDAVIADHLRCARRR
ncbi:MAG: hypothetical protein B7X11_03475 [Acidobacteria bacterium 37-65-4]|nr:MAG: hypothetical protein B7X11_03475 [Acidobacteria bacterium 37-65-4]